MNGARLSPGDPEEGAIGKVLLIVVAIIVLIGVAIVALWNPVIRPLIGEAVPVRVTQATPFEVPYDDPQIRVVVPTDWTMQRALYNPQQALLKSPDLGTHVMIDTWKHGASPTLHTAIAEATDGWQDTADTLYEELTPDLHAASVIGSVRSGGDEQLIVAVASANSPDLRAAAIFTVTTDRDRIDEVLPAIAEMLSQVEVP